MANSAVKRVRGRIGACAAALLLLICVSGMNAPAGPSETAVIKESKVLFGAGKGSEAVPGELVVLFDEAVGTEAARAIFAGADASVKKQSRVNRSRFVVSVPPGAEEEYAKTLRRKPEVLFAERNHVYYAQFVPNDTNYEYQWHFNKPDFIHAEEGWDVERGDPGVIVAVVDTGVAYETHPVPGYELGEVRGDRYVQAPDLAGTNFVSGYDFVHDDEHPNDQNGHGTHVAGTIAQTTNNGMGVAGLAHLCTIMPLQTLDYRGEGTLDDVADGIDYARLNGANVINLSLGSPDYSDILKDVCDAAEKAGIVVVAASSNNGESVLHYPAAFESVIAVGAVDYDGALAYYSNYGDGQEVSAPGGDTTVDLNGDGYADGVLQMTFEEMYEPGFFNETKAKVDTFAYVFLQGTSMACPHVSALAALLISNGVTSNVTVRESLRNTATDLGDWGYDESYGYGLINVEGALKNIVPEGMCGDCGGSTSYELGFLFTIYAFVFAGRRLVGRVKRG